MKHFFTRIAPVLIAVSLMLNSCTKDDANPGTDPVLNVLYPSQVSFYEGNNSAYPTVWSFQYDGDNNLVKYGLENSMIREVSNHGVNAIFTTSNAQLMLSYAFRMYGDLQTSVSIYDGAPTEVSIDQFNKNLSTGVVTSSHFDTYQFTNYADGLLQKQIQSSGGGYNYNYSYDENKNLKEINYVSLSGPGAGLPYARVRVVELDDHPSPYFAVKGYRFASYPQSYVPEIVSAFCHNNAIRVVVEDLDPATNQWKLYEEDDYTYTYNEQGYPVHTALTITYHTAQVSHFYRTFDYTYRQ